MEVFYELFLGIFTLYLLFVVSFSLDLCEAYYHFLDELTQKLPAPCRCNKLAEATNSCLLSSLMMKW